jgi:ribonucleases P/MRP protein subunit RPP40
MPCRDGVSCGPVNTGAIGEGVTMSTTGMVLFGVNAGCITDRGKSIGNEYLGKSRSRPNEFGNSCGNKNCGKQKDSCGKLKCFYVNARSIINKRDDLELYISDENPDIIGITETWAVENIEDAELVIDGYTMMRKDRVVGTKVRGGGVLLYVKNLINVVLREDYFDNNFQECIWCDIEIGGEKTLVGLCYRPPDSNKTQDEALFKMLAGVSREKLLLMGDFNFPELNWGKPETLDDSHSFLKCINDNFLIQCVENSTRGNNVLDLVFTSEENMIENLTVGEPFGTSDHQIIRWYFSSIKETIKRNDEIKMHDYFKADYDGMREEISSIDFDEIIIGDSVEQDWDCFKLIMEKLKDKWVPFRRNKVGKCKWVNNSVTRRRRAKNKAWERYQNQKSQENLEKYKIKLNKSNSTNRSAKRNYEKKLAGDVKSNNKSFFAYVRSKQRTKDKVGPLKNNVGKVIEEDEETANLLNCYFSSVFTIEDCSNVPEPLKVFKGKMEEEGLTEIKITSELVENKLTFLKVDKCPGLDGIHPKMLYELRKEIAGPLAKLYNTSLDSGIVPGDWKDAGVTPLFKKGKKSDAQNYRPVSMTSLICKIMESILKDAIMSHLDKLSLIRDSQHGFTRGRSCLTNLLEFLEKITLELDEGKPVDLIYLDFAKAFDKVPYERLFRKLMAHGIGGEILKWIQGWLTGRRQKVSINKTYSNWRDVLSGVPQGSVLGPLLFLIYVNDLDVDVFSKLLKFADDTKLGRGISSENDVKILREDLTKIFQWSIDWQMTFNTEKCTVIHMGKNNKEAEYKMGGNVLKKSKKERDLGVIIDYTGKPSEQCVMAVKKANSVLGMIKRNITFKSKEVIVRLYKSLVRPRLEHCVQAWSPHLRKDIDMLERVQRRATKLIEGYRDICYEDRLRKTGLISLEKRRVRGDLIQTFKIMKRFDKVDYRDFFEISNVGKTRGHSLKLTKKRSNGDTRKHFFSQRVINSWNGLPQEVIDADTINCFKNRLDKFDKYF